MHTRFAEVDALKAIGIVTVVLIHSIRSPFDPGVSPGEIWIGHLTRFAVPAFLMASGFLYAGATDSILHLTLRRLRRIAVPYLIASGCAQLWFAAHGTRPETGSWIADVLFGASLGPYYFVFLIVGLVIATPAFALLSRRGIAIAATLLLAAQWWSDAAIGYILPFFWAVRNPLMWWAYFAIGWMLRQHHAAIVAWIAPRRRLVLSVLVGLVLCLSIASGFSGPSLFVRTAAWADIYAVCALIFVSTAGLGRISPALQYLSEASYSIFLLHIVFVLAVVERVPLPFQRVEFLPVALAWAAGLFGSLMLIAGLKAALGRHSRNWIGA